MFGEWCTALHKNPPDTDKCNKKPEIKENLFNAGKIAIGAYVYHKTKQGNRVVFEHKRDVEDLAPADDNDDDVLFVRDEPDSVVEERSVPSASAAAGHVEYSTRSENSVEQAAPSVSAAPGHVEFSSRSEDPEEPEEYPLDLVAHPEDAY